MKTLLPMTADEFCNRLQALGLVPSYDKAAIKSICIEADPQDLVKMTVVFYPHADLTETLK